MKEWHSVIPYFRIDFDCDIYVTGSNSKLLSGELATNMAGRYVSFHVYPFVLSEIQEFYEVNELPYTREQLFTDYLKYGGLPMRLVLPDEHSVRTYLEDSFFCFSFLLPCPSGTLKNSPPFPCSGIKKENDVRCSFSNSVQFLQNKKARRYCLEGRRSL